MKPDSDYVKRLVDKGKVVITSATEYTSSGKAVDGPALGNGDMGVVIRTEEDGYVFLLGKNDFWRQPYLYETSEQRKEKLLKKSCRRTGGRIIPVGWLRLQFEGLKQKRFHITQSPYEAMIDADIAWENSVICMKSWVCAVQNLLVIELDNRSDKEVCIDFSIMPGEYDVYEVDGYEDGYADDSVWFTYGAEPYHVPGKRRVAVVAASDAEVKYCPDRMAKKGGVFSVRAGEKAKLLLNLLSDLDAEKPSFSSTPMTRISISDWKRKTEKQGRCWNWNLK